MTFLEDKIKTDQVMGTKCSLMEIECKPSSLWDDRPAKRLETAESLEKRDVLALQDTLAGECPVEVWPYGMPTVVNPYVVILGMSPGVSPASGDRDYDLRPSYELPSTGTPHPRWYYADSRGYWDGDTLVIETKNFSDMVQSFLASPYGNAREKSLTERFTRVNETTVEYEFTIDDPGTFTDKITAMVPMTRVDGLLYEYSCHEGNYGMTNLLRGERRQEMDALGIE